MSPLSEDGCDPRYPDMTKCAGEGGELSDAARYNLGLLINRGGSMCHVIAPCRGLDDVEWEVSIDSQHGGRLVEVGVNCVDQFTDIRLAFTVVDGVVTRCEDGDAVSAEVFLATITGIVE